MNIYRQMSLPVKASLWFIVSNVIQKGISFISTPIFTRLLTTEEYGVFSVYSSWYNIVAIFCTLQLSAGVYNKGMTKWPEARDKLTSSLQGLSTFVTFLFFIVYLVASDFWDNLFGLSSALMLTLFVETLCVPAYNFWAASQRYDYKYKGVVIASILIGVLSPILGVLAVKVSPYKAEARVISYAFVQIVFGVFLYIFNLRKGKCFFDKKMWLYGLSFNLPLVPHYLAQTVLGSSDRIMISKMVGIGQAGIYSVAYTVSTLFSLVTIAINRTYIPYTFKAMKNKEYGSIRKTSLPIALLVCGMCTFAICLGPEIISIVSTSEYYEAKWVVPPVAASTFFSFLYVYFANVEFYYEKTKFVMIASSFAAFLNVLLNYIFIRIFGYIAAAYTTLACYMVLMLIHYVFYCKLCRDYRIGGEMYDVKSMFLLGVLNLLSMFILTAVYDFIVVRYIVICIFVCLIILCRHKIANVFSILRNR